MFCYKTLTLVLVVTASLFVQSQSLAQAYSFALELNNPDLITHVSGYDGTGGNLNITVGIDQTSVNAVAAQVSVANAVTTWNRLNVTTNNLQFGQIGASEIDFESVLLHELGHALGLAHPNIGGSGPGQEFTQACAGFNGVHDLNAGADGIAGSSDDIRGDDVNFNYFQIGVNNPFAALPSVIDSTTFSNDLADLPSGHTFSANGSRDVAAALGLANTESVLQQGTFAGETQRTLAAPDVVGILLAASGLDEIQGTADDYTYTLEFVGLTDGADILIDFDNDQTGFAVAQSGGRLLDVNHAAVTTSDIFFNSNVNWFFNQVSNVPEPGSVLVLTLATVCVLNRRRRQS